MNRLLLRLVGLVLVALPVLHGCGHDSDDDDEEEICCLGGVFYDCSDTDDHCIEPFNDCVRDPSRDDKCM